MSSRIRGQEATLRVTVADEFAPAFGIFGVMAGSFMKVRDLSITARTDLVEEPYIGEDFDDLDIQHHGFDFAFTIDELDNSALNYLSLITFKEQNKLPPPVIVIAVTYIYRERSITTPTRPHTEVLSECVMKQAERSLGGRKEYIQNSYEGKAKQRNVIIG